MPITNTGGISKPSGASISKVISMAGSGISIASLAAMFSHMIIEKMLQSGSAAMSNRHRFIQVVVLFGIMLGNHI